MLTAVGKRIMELMKHKGFTQQTLADKIGLARSALSLYAGGHREMSQQVAMAFQAALGIRWQWLLHGEGDMMLPPTVDLPQDEADALKLYRTLDKSRREELLHFGEYLTMRKGRVVKEHDPDTPRYPFDKLRQVPLVGQIAAGLPIRAEQNIEQVLDVPYTLLSGSGPFFALRVRGDSMTGAHVLDGDIALIRENHDVTDILDGAIVAAVLGEEATLKRLRKRGELYELHAENPDYAPILPNREDGFYIAGVLVAVWRGV